MGARALVLGAVLCLAGLVCVTRGGAQPMSPADAAAQRLRGEAEALENWHVDFDTDDPMAAMEPMQRAQRIADEITTQLRSVSRAAHPATYASLQTTLAAVYTTFPPPPVEDKSKKVKAPKNEAEAQAWAQAESVHYYDAAKAAIAAALSAVSRESAPMEWARAQAQRGATLRQDWLVTRQPAVQREIAEADAAALTVFTRGAFPYEYLQVRCASLDDDAPVTAEAYEAMRETTDVRETVLSSVCMTLDGADASSGGRAGQMRKAVLDLAGPRMRTDAEGVGWTTMQDQAEANAKAQQSFKGPGLLGGLLYRDTIKQAKEAMAESVRQSAEQERELREGNGGRVIVDMIDSGRAFFLSAALSLDQAGLGEADLRRARALRARADRLAEAAPAGAAARANTALWAARAELYDILAAGNYPPRAPAPPAEAPIIAPIMLDQERGFAATKPVSGDGALIPTSLAWVREITANNSMAVQGEEIARMNELNAAAAKRTQKAFSNPLGMIPIVGMFARPSTKELIRQGQQDAAKMQAESEAAAQRRATRDQAARTERAMADWTPAYRAGRFKNAIDDFRQRFEPAWGAVLHTAAQKGGAATGGRLVILPDGLASALPIGLLRDPRTGRSLIEDYEIVYAPNLTAYAAARRRAGQAAPSVAAFALDPKESGLPFAPAEARLAEAAFTTAQPLRASAGKSALFAQLHNASYWHFATHGVFDWANPRKSGLDLGGGERLSLEELYGAEDQIGAPRLVVLSACETGLFDAQNDPDDFIGLPTGFLQAGAAGVIASLWQVPDVSSTLLMAKFYDLHRGQGQRPSQALRGAQLWLKAARRADLSAFVEALEKRGAISAGQSDLLLGAVASAEGAAPFAHPYYWGAWVYYGA